MFNRKEAKKILEGDQVSPLPSAEVKLFFSLSYCTGLAVETVRELKWENLYLDKEMIRTVEVDEEDDEEVEVNFDHALTVWIEKLKEKSGAAGDKNYIFTEANEEPVTIDTIQKHFESAMGTAGIDFRKRKLTPNSFRRTYNFWYA